MVDLLFIWHYMLIVFHVLNSWLYCIFLTTFIIQWRRQFNQTFFVRTISFVVCTSFPSTDLYIHSCILAVAPEECVNEWVDIYIYIYLCFLRARFLILRLHFIARLWFPAAGCLRFEPNIHSSQDPALDFSLNKKHGREESNPRPPS